MRVKIISGPYKDILARMRKLNPKAAYPTGFESCIVGMQEAKAGGNWIFRLSREKIVKVLMDRDEMSREDAEEYISFNMEGTHLGGFTMPKYVR